jgi:hypothetical protein
MTHDEPILNDIWRAIEGFDTLMTSAAATTKLAIAWHTLMPGLFFALGAAWASRRAIDARRENPQSPIPTGEPSRPSVAARMGQALGNGDLASVVRAAIVIIDERPHLDDVDRELWLEAARHALGDNQ